MQNELYFENPTTHVILHEKAISLVRGSHDLMIHKAMRGETQIFYDQIIEIKFKAPSALGKGYIQFCTARTSMLGTLRTADQPQNAIKFKKNRQADALLLRDFVNAKIAKDEETANAVLNKINDGPELHRKRQSKGCLNRILIFLAVIVALLIVLVVAALNSDPSETATTESPSVKVSDTYSTSALSTTQTEKASESNVPIEYMNALESAQFYSDRMHMSKQGIYDQLVSEYGGQFSDEAAQYAIDNVKADYKQNALEQAKTYQESMHMSREEIRDQLSSEYGGQFTQEEADYAVDHLSN